VQMAATDNGERKRRTLSPFKPIFANGRSSCLHGNDALLRNSLVDVAISRRAQLKELGFSVITFLLLFFSWNELITWNWARINQICRSTTVYEASPTIPSNTGEMDWKKCESYFLGADPLEYELYFRRFPGSLPDFIGQISDARARQTLLVEIHKRPLFGPLTALATSIVGTLSGLPHPERMHAVLALYASICSLLLFRLLRWAGSSIALALCATTVATASFSWLSVFSIPESYSLSVAATIIAARSGMSLSRATERHEEWAIVAHSLVIGIASWLYLPACGALFFGLSPFPRRPKALRVPLTLGVSICALALSPQLILGGFAQVATQMDYGMQWGSISNLLDLDIWLEVIAAFLVFSIVAPADHALTIPGTVQWYAVHSLPVIASAACVIASYILLIRSATLRGMQLRDLVGPAFWLISLLTFHVIFNPREVLLYTSPPLVLIVLMASLIIKQIHLPPRTILPIGLCIAGALAAVNLRALT